MKPVFAYATMVAFGISACGPALAAGGNPKHPRPPESFQGQWYTTPGGCSYSRAKAPGYAVSWHLILNPHHIGKPKAKASCPPQL